MRARFIWSVIIGLYGMHAAADEKPIVFGNQLFCSGPSEADGRVIEVVLLSSDSFLTMESPEPPREVVVYFKSQIKGGRWFGVRPAEAPAQGQDLTVVQRDERTEILKGSYGASLTLSSGKPRVDIIHQAVKFEIYMEKGGGPNEILVTGYLAIRPNGNQPPIIVPELRCEVQPYSVP